MTLIWYPSSRLFRSAGLQRMSTVSWEITPMDSTVFVTTADTVFFGDGEEEATVVVQVGVSSNPVYLCKSQAFAHLICTSW